ncbi:MAG: F0F1 ATP synthase subunit B [Deltaproteobacteria bacterium]|nr:F0F1 ATP synthase subunit B [Deltaproteobacteria bacterium]
MADRSNRKRFLIVAAQTLTGMSVLLYYTMVFASAGQGGEHGYSSKLWWDLVWRTMNFIILAAVLFKVLKKPIGNLLSGRQASIKDNFDELDAKKVEAEKRYAEYEKKLSTIEQEAKKVVQEYIEQGEAEKRRIIEEAQKAAELIKKQAQFAVEQEMKRAKLALSAEAAELSVKLAEDIIKKNLNESDHKKLIDEYIAKVVHTN